MGRSHGGFKVQSLNVLPVLLKKGHQLVDGHDYVDVKIFDRHVHLADWYTHTHRFLALKRELDSGFKLLDLGLHIFRVGQTGRELAGLGETRSHNARKLLNQSGRGEESVVLLG